MRAILVLGAVAACGRIGFDTAPDAGNGGGDAAGDGPLVMPGPALACSETIPAGASPITGTALEAVVTPRGLAAFWLGSGGGLFGTTWTAATDGTLLVVKDAVSLAPGPFVQLWATGNGDEILVATLGSEMTARFLHGDLTSSHADAPLGTAAPGGREPFTRKLGGTSFAVISIAGDDPAIFELPPPSPGIARLLIELRFHGAPSIAADGDGYTVTTEFADQFGPGCWVSRLSENLAVLAGPGSLELTQQADCDSSTVVPSAIGAAMAWMDRDPANSYAAFRAPTGGSATASMAGEIGVRLPIVTATSTGAAVLYRSNAGVRVFDGAGARTLAPPGALADLVTWGDRAIAVWTAASGAVQLTRLCPASSP